MIEILANLIELLILLSKMLKNVPKLFYLSLIVKTFLSEFSNLNLIIGSIEKLPLCLFKLDPQKFNFIREPLYLDSLEDDYEIYIIAKIVFLIVGEILDS